MSSISIACHNSKQAIMLLKDAFEREYAVLQLGLERTKERIKAFEKKYGCRLIDLSETMRKRIDDLTLTEWEGETEILRVLKEQLSELKDMRVCR